MPQERRVRIVRAWRVPRFSPYTRTLNSRRNWNNRGNGMDFTLRLSAADGGPPMNRSLLLAPALLALSLSPALAQSKCFSIREFEGWRAPDAKTINIRVGQTRYYRLDLGNA